MNILFDHIRMPQPWTPGGDYPERQTAFGLPVILDPDMPRGEMWIVDELGIAARIRDGVMTIRESGERDARRPRSTTDETGTPNPAPRRAGGMMNWIKTAERLPEPKEGDRILIACDVPEYLEHTRYRPCAFEGGAWVTNNGATVDLSGHKWITHWLPIVPPEGSGG